LNTATFITNRLPITANNGIIPFECFTNKVPNLCHVRVFGCKAFILEKEKALTKLNARSYTSILLGYNEHTKGYKCWIPSKYSVILSRNVRFDDSEILNRVSVVTIHKLTSSNNPVPLSPAAADIDIPPKVDQAREPSLLDVPPQPAIPTVDTDYHPLED
jgi:hypothetical protein